MSLFESLGSQLRRARQDRGFTQPMLAERIGRDRGRVSELERDLLGGRLGKDRLTLLAQICDALDLTPVLVPRDKREAVLALLGEPPRRAASAAAPDVFDELFVDLSEEPR